MNDNQFSEIITLIEGKRSERSLSNEPVTLATSLVQIYAAALMPLPYEHVKNAVIDLCVYGQNAPTVAEILNKTASLVSPVPDADEVFADLVEMARRKGMQAKPHPERPTVFIDGPPDFDHELTERAVRAVGGWQAFCNAEESKLGILKKQFSDAMQTCAADWLKSVSVELRKPEHLRDTKYFPSLRRPVLRIEAYAVRAGELKAKAADGEPLPDQTEIDNIKARCAAFIGRVSGL